MTETAPVLDRAPVLQAQVARVYEHVPEIALQYGRCGLESASLAPVTVPGLALVLDLNRTPCGCKSPFSDR